MHHYPEDDDHPDADMWRGQRFIVRVYNALRQNDEVWNQTLLVITYDEHGGLYDHVVPPIADVYQPRSAGTSLDDTGRMPHRPGSAATGEPQSHHASPLDRWRDMMDKRMRGRFSNRDAGATS